jgi:hypothetical protein
MIHVFTCDRAKRQSWIVFDPQRSPPGTPPEGREAIYSHFSAVPNS